jgi:hypothetical protein
MRRNAVRIACRSAAGTRAATGRQILSSSPVLATPLTSPAADISDRYVDQLVAGIALDCPAQWTRLAAMSEICRSCLRPLVVDALAGRMHCESHGRRRCANTRGLGGRCTGAAVGAERPGPGRAPGCHVPTGEGGRHDRSSAPRHSRRRREARHHGWRDAAAFAGLIAALDWVLARLRRRRCGRPSSACCTGT